MNKEDFVSLQCAKLLKEKGFDEPCTNRYVIPIEGTEREVLDDEEDMMCTQQDCEIYPKPTLYESQKWLRKNHTKYVCIENSMDSSWNYFVEDIDGKNEIITMGDWVFPTYESALNAGIIEALKLIN